MKKKKNILVIDNGLTVIKAAIFDLRGRMLGSDAGLNTVIDHDCFSEIDPNLLWEKTASIINNAIVKSRVNPSDIAAIGNTGFGAGIFLVDRSGCAIRNAVTSMDTRALDFVEKSRSKQDIFYEKTKINMWSAQAIPLLHWLKENEHANFKRIHKILQVKDWIKFKLTGSCSGDYSDFGNTGLLNLDQKSYDPELYKYYGLEEINEFLPDLKACYQVTGYTSKDAAAVTGLSAGTPVMCGLMDVVACAVGSGLHKTDKYSIISGTWNINTAVGPDIVESEDIMACLLYADSKNYFYMDASPTSAVNYEWFLKSVIEKMHDQNMDRTQLYKKADMGIQKILKKKSQLLYFPFIYRSKLVGNTMGSFTGINASDDVFDMIYAIYQGVAFAHLMHIGNLKKGNVYRNRAVLSGGASNSDLWCQVFADTLNIELETLSLKEVGLLGTAISVLMGLENTSIEEAIDRMVNVKSVFKPDADMHKRYMEKFQNFKSMIGAFESI